MKQLRLALSGLVCLLAAAVAAAPAEAVTYAYVPGYDNDTLIRVQISDSTFESLTIDPNILSNATCNPYGAAVKPGGNFALFTCEGDDSVLRVNNTDFSDDTYSRTPISVGDTPRGVAIEPSGDYAYVANYEDDTISKIDLFTYQVSGSPIDVGDGPMGVAAIRNADDVVVVYVTNYLDGTISVITDDGQTQTKTISGVGSRPVGIAATPDGKYLYVANQGLENTAGSGSVICIRTRDNTIVDTGIVTGEGFWGVAIGNMGAWVYVSNTSANRGTVISTTDNTVSQDNLAVGGLTYGAAAPRNGDYAYVVKQSDGTITEVDLSAATPYITTGIKDADHPLETPYALGAFIGGVPPARPSDLTGTATSYDRIELTWTDNSDDELGFKIERRIQAEDDEEENSYIRVARVSADTTSYTDAGLLGGTTYEYRINAYNEAADSDYVTTGASGGVTTEEGGFSWCFIGTLLGR